MDPLGIVGPQTMSSMMAAVLENVAQQAQAQSLLVSEASFDPLRRTVTLRCCERGDVLMRHTQSHVTLSSLPRQASEASFDPLAFLLAVHGTHSFAALDAGREKLDARIRSQARLPRAPAGTRACGAPRREKEKARTREIKRDLERTRENQVDSAECARVSVLCVARPHGRAVACSVPHAS